MNQEAWSRLEGKLDKCSDTLGDLNGRTIRIESSLEEFRSYRERAEEDSSTIEHDVKDLNTRVTAVEALEVKKYDARLKKVEELVSRLTGGVAGATGVVTVISGFVLWYLTQIVRTLT